MTEIPVDKTGRLNRVIDLACGILFNRVCSGRVVADSEASLQLHMAVLLRDLGEAFCTDIGEAFTLELEKRHGRCNIDIVCAFADVRAALELKYFINASATAMDLDMYNVLKDIERLQTYTNDGFAAGRFLCITNSAIYSEPGANEKPDSYIQKLSIRNGAKYPAGTIVPPWAGKGGSYKNCSREIVLRQAVEFDWKKSGEWRCLEVVIE